MLGNQNILLLGAIAGFTIFLGLPIGRASGIDRRLKAGLNAVAIGVLLFLLWDVLSQAVDPIEAALTAATEEHKDTWGEFTKLSVVAIAFFSAGLLSLVHFDGWMQARRHRHGQPQRLGVVPTEPETKALADTSTTQATPAELALMIATGIGLHNFSEGLAIGQSAASGKIGLALLLVIGFGLHNATEGFGIVAPLAGERRKPSWKFLGLLGLIGGGPTFLGTLIGQSVVNMTLSVGFLAAAAGSILFVVIELLAINRHLGHRTLVAWCLVGGLVLGFATDFILIAAGA
jgi:ZIP family zinc transporter